MGILQLDNQQKGLRFDGTNDFVETQSTVNITTQTNSISMICRFNSISDAVFYVNNEGAGNGIIAYIQSSQIAIQRGRGGTAGDARFNVSLNTSTVYHFVFVYNSDLTIDLYINGVLQTRASQTLAGSCIANIVLKIGKTQPFLTYLSGTVYDFKLFTKSLTQTEVTELYNSRCTQIPSTASSSLLINYLFNQNSGLLLSDISGNSYTSNLINYTAGDVTIGSTNKWVYDYGSESYDAKRKNGVLQINNN
jgi:hypothetical protein